MKRSQTLLAIGAFTLIGAILIGRYVETDIVWINFLEGLFYGVSFVVNIAALISASGKKNKK